MISFRDKAFLVGVVGDIFLQLYIRLFRDLAGLKPYFQRHYPFESVCIAAATMYIVAYLYELTGLPLTIPYLFIFGGIADIVWRQFKLMPSLDQTYYKALTPIESFIWGGIPMVLPLFI